MVRKTRRSKKGGKFIFSGAYGCAFSPAIKCKTSKTRKNGYISKVMTVKTAQDEVKPVKLLQNLNSGFQYFLYPDEMCDPEPVPTNEAEKCPLKFKNAPVALLSPYGGSDLWHINVPSRDIPAFFEGLVNVFDGLALLHANGYIHNDIKPLNIVGLKGEDGSYKIRIIDFGLTSSISKYIQNPIVVDYPYYPYDLRLLSSDYFPKKADFDNFYNALAYNNFPVWMYLNDSEKIINAKWVMSIWKKMREEKDSLYKVVVGCDVFAWGRSIYDIYTRLTHNSFEYPGVVHGPPSLLRDKVSLPLFNLVKKMCDPDPFLRISMADAKAEYLTFLPEFRNAIDDKRKID